MRILFVWDGDYPWDIRVEKICDSFIASGHAVHLVCRNTRNESRLEHHRGITLHRLPYFPSLSAGANKALTLPLFFNPLWLAQLARVARETDCDVVFVRDLPLAPSAVMLAKSRGIPCIYDMAECYPEMYKGSRQVDPFRFSHLLLKNPQAADLLERFVVKSAHRTLVMVEESRQRLLKRGMSSEKIVLVSNTPLLERFTAPPPREEGRPLTAIYQGLLNPARGLKTVLDACARYCQRNPKFRLILVGTGKAEKALRAQAKTLALENNVEFTGWIDNKAIPGLIAQSDIGIVPHYRTPHTDHTVPNKLFDYMAAGKPVLVTDARPLARVVTECDAGLVYPDRDAEALAQALTRLEKPQLRLRLGNNGRRAVETRYNWRADEQRLLAAMHTVKPAFAV